MRHDRLDPGNLAMKANAGKGKQPNRYPCP